MFSGVRLYDVTLGDALLSLCEYARASSSLTTLTLSGVLPTENLLKRSPAKALGDALAAGARGALPLTSLDLSDNELRDQGFVALAQFLTNLRHGLTELNLNECHASQKGVSALVASLRGAQHVETLEQVRLARNDIGPRANCVMLADFVASAKALAQLDLRGTSCAVRLVTAALTQSPACATLRELDVGSNRLSRADVAGLLHFVGGSIALSSLGLSRCGLEPEALVALVQAMQLNSKIAAVRLDASGNPLGTLGGHMLAAALAQSTKLSGLLLSDVTRSGPDLPSRDAGMDAIDALPTREPSGSSAGGVVPAFGVLIIEALLGGSSTGSSTGSSGEGGCLGRLTELALGQNPAPQPPQLLSCIERLARTATRLQVLTLSGSSSFRLRNELPLLLAQLAAAASSGGARLSHLDVSCHHAGDALIEAAAPLLSGNAAPRAFLLHDNQLTTSGIEALSQHLLSPGRASGVGEDGGGVGSGRQFSPELLVITHEDARFALNAELAMKRPKDMAARRLQRAVTAVQETILRHRARRHLYPRMRHPRRVEGSSGTPRVLSWPHWPQLFQVDGKEGTPPGASALPSARPDLEWKDERRDEDNPSPTTAAAAPNAAHAQHEHEHEHEDQPPPLTPPSDPGLPPFNNSAFSFGVAFDNPEASSSSFNFGERQEESSPTNFDAPPSFSTSFDGMGSFEAAFDAPAEPVPRTAAIVSTPSEFDSTFGSSFDSSFPSAAAEPSLDSGFAATFDSGFSATDSGFAATDSGFAAADSGFAATFDSGFASDFSSGGHDLATSNAGFAVAFVAAPFQADAPAMAFDANGFGSASFDSAMPPMGASAPLNAEGSKDTDGSVGFAASFGDGPSFIPTEVAVVDALAFAVPLLVDDPTFLDDVGGAAALLDDPFEMSSPVASPFGSKPELSGANDEFAADVEPSLPQPASPIAPAFADHDNEEEDPPTLTSAFSSDFTGFDHMADHGESPAGGRSSGEIGRTAFGSQFFDAGFDSPDVTAEAAATTDGAHSSVESPSAAKATVPDLDVLDTSDFGPHFTQANLAVNSESPAVVTLPEFTSEPPAASPDWDEPLAEGLPVTVGSARGVDEVDTNPGQEAAPAAATAPVEEILAAVVGKTAAQVVADEAAVPAESKTAAGVDADIDKQAMVATKVQERLGRARAARAQVSGRRDSDVTSEAEEITIVSSLTSAAEVVDTKQKAEKEKEESDAQLEVEADIAAQVEEVAGVGAGAEDEENVGAEAARTEAAEITADVSGAGKVECEENTDCQAADPAPTEAPVVKENILQGWENVASRVELQAAKGKEDSAVNTEAAIADVDSGGIEISAASAVAVECGGDLGFDAAPPDTTSGFDAGGGFFAAGSFSTASAPAVSDGDANVEVSQSVGRADDAFGASVSFDTMPFPTPFATTSPGFNDGGFETSFASESQAFPTIDASNTSFGNGGFETSFASTESQAFPAIEASKPIFGDGGFETSFSSTESQAFPAIDASNPSFGDGFETSFGSTESQAFPATQASNPSFGDGGFEASFGPSQAFPANGNEPEPPPPDWHVV